MEIGDTILLQDSTIEEHLWIVISDPGRDADKVVIVNLESCDGPEKDGSCILDRGDHPWIRHKTNVRYRDARITTQANLDHLIKNGALKPQEPATDELLAKIFDGAQKTEHLPTKCRTVLELQGLIERQ